MLATSEEFLLNNLRIEIQQLDELPPIPIIGQELLQALNDNTTDINTVAEIILKDAALSAKLLGLANSAFFGFGRTFDDLRDAIINVLGLDLVRGISLGMIVNHCFDPKQCHCFDMEKYWAHCLFTASLVKSIGKKTNLAHEISPGFMYLYGLLHSLGKLILATGFPKEIECLFNHRLPDRPLSNTELIAYEIKYLGASHCDAALFLGMKWNLPEDVVHVMSHYANTKYTGPYIKQTVLTGACSSITEQWLIGNEDVQSLEPETLKLLEIDMNDIAQITQKEYTKKNDILKIASQF